MIAEEHTPGQYAIILLAAGSSSRMGRPKQLLDYNGTSLLSHIINVSTAVNAATVVVILGANAELLEKELTGKQVFIVRNNNWSEGIASSIRCGLNALPVIVPNCKAALFVTCDQPFVSSSLLNDLIDTHEKTGKPIVASYYENTPGIPVLFHRNFFPELIELKGDAGAKKIILNHRDMVAEVAFPLGNIDIDTMANYEPLNKIRPC